MTSRHTEGKVRDLELTMEDAARLAECFNSFDDSDSWPGGFTHGNPFTAQRVYDDLSKQKPIRRIVAYTDDKIVGHCDVCYPEVDPESSYVGLLGVNPAYQRQGFGKALLIEAAETAVKFNKRRIDLHTWAGNLKALPLYKRCGYNWVPGTRVLMESHIPGIIGCDFFKEFFDRHYWYDSFKREIKQEMDNIVENGVGVFKYHFEGDNGDFLDVTVDREAKGVCSFVLRMDGKTISADLRPEKHVGFIGFGKTLVKLRIKNEGDEQLPYSVFVSPDERVSVDFLSATTGSVDTGQEIEVLANYEVLPKADHLDRQSTPDIKVETQAEWSLTLGGKSINLYSGVIPQEAVSLSVGPRFPTLGVGESKELVLGFKNNTESNITGKVVFKPLIGPILEKQAVEIKIKAGGDTYVPLKVQAENIDQSKLISIETSVYVTENSGETMVNRRMLNIGVFGSEGALAYECLESGYVLETETFRFTMNKLPPMFVRGLEHKITGREFNSRSLLPSLGYPFPSGGTEWERKKFQVTLRNERDYAEIELVGDSIDHPGLKLTIFFRAYAGREYLEMTTRFENLGSTTQKNLGIRVGGWMPLYFDEMYIPLNNEIYRMNSCEWHGYRQLPNSPDMYHENWSAMVQADGSLAMGYIWDRDGLKELIPKRSWGINTFEYTLPDLEPGTIFEKRLFDLFIGHGSWQRVRSLWARLNGVSLDNEGPIEIRSDLELELVQVNAEEGKATTSPVLVDRVNENELELRVRVTTEESMSAGITLKLPEGLVSNGKREFEFKAEGMTIKNPFKQKINVTVEENADWVLTGGEIKFTGTSRIHRVPITAIVYNSSISEEKKTEAFDTLKLHTLTSGRSRMAVSAEYAGALAKFGPTGEDSYFYDTYPKVNPFIWWDKHYSGWIPIIWSVDIWDWESDLYKENWGIKATESGVWQGYELSSTLEHCPKLKGVEMKVRYLQLKDVPIVYAEVKVTNKTPQWIEFYLGFRGSPRLNGKSQSWIYSVANGTEVVYQPTKSETDVRVAPEAGWAAYFEPESGKILGVVATTKANSVISADNLGASAQMIWIRDKRQLPPNGSTYLSCYLIAAPSIESVRLARGLPPIE